MTRRLVRLAALNAPRHTVNKPRVVGPDQQARLIASAIHHNHVDHCSLAEAYTALTSALGQRPLLEVTRARANDVFPGTRIGNATVSRVPSGGPGPAGWDRLDRYDLTLDGGDKPLNQGVVLSRRATDGLQVTTIAGHLWSRPAAGDAEWTAGAVEVRDYAEELTGAVGLMFDWNRNRTTVTRAFPARAGWRVAAWGGVSGVLVRGLEPVRERAVTTLWPEATDHREGMVIGVCRAGTPDNTMDRLPR